MASTAERQFLNGAAAGYAHEHDAGVVRTYIPEERTLVHEQALLDTVSQGDTDQENCAELVVAVLGTSSQSEGIRHSLTVAGLHTQEQLAGARVVIIADDLVQFTQNEPTLLAGLERGTIVVTTAVCPPYVLKDLETRLNCLDQQVALVEASGVELKTGSIVSQTVQRSARFV